MVNSNRWNVQGATLVQLVAEAFCLVVAVLLALLLHGPSATSVDTMLAPALVFAVLMVTIQGAFGLYRRDCKIGLGTHALRLFLAMLIVAPIVYVLAAILPGGRGFRDIVGESMMLAFVGLILVRHVVVGPALKTILPHRVLVLGTGSDALLVENSLKTADSPGLQLVGFMSVDDIPESVVSPSRIVGKGKRLEDVVRKFGVNEIIVAVRQRRGGILPMKALLECRLAGVKVTDLPRFFERVHGQIPVGALNASWLIYGSGFRQSVWRTTVKRLFDIVVALTLILLTWPIMIATAIVIVFESGFPVLYRQERVGLRGAPLNVLKFRSMRQDAEKDGDAKWATVGDTRVTRFGRFLRRSRIDELPQLINVLRGEMSLVGPRPERPVFVAMLTEEIPFYAVRLTVKPGITGWAQVRYAYGANIEESMTKLEYDLYYVKNHTLFLDMLILIETVRVVLFGEGAR